MAFEAGRGGSGLEPKLAGLRLTPADFAGRRRRTPQDLGRILAGPGTGPSGPAVLGGPMPNGMTLWWWLEPVHRKRRAVAASRRRPRSSIAYVPPRGCLALLARLVCV